MADSVATDFISSMKAKGRKALDWFKKIVRKTQRAAMPASTGRREILTDRNTGITTRPIIGRMYLFQYDAKWKEKLPWWDMWPLIFPFDYAKGGFYGLNFHYLPFGARVAFLRQLSRYTTDNRYDKNTRYQLPSLSGEYYKKTVKHYLFNHVRTSFLNIPADEMAIAIFLPVARFMKGRPY